MKHRITALVLTLVIGITCTILIVQAVSAQGGGTQGGSTTFYTVGNAIRDIAVHGDYVWVATTGGVMRWHAQTGSYLKFTTRDGLPGNYVSSIAVGPDGSVWIAAGGAARYDGERWQSVTAQGLTFNQSVSKIAISPSGEPWIVMDGSVYVVHQNGTWDVYTKSHGLISPSVQDIAFEGNGTVWIGTQDGLNRIRPDGTWDTYTKTHGLAANNVEAIAIDHNGNRWFGGGDWDPAKGYVGGVTELTPGGNWITYTKADGLADEGVHAIVIDSVGNRWFGTDQGLNRFSTSGTWTTWSENSGLPNLGIPGLAVDANDHVWIGTYGGLSEFNGAGLVNHIILDGLVAEARGLEPDQSNGIWIAGDAVQRFDGHDWQLFTTGDGLSSNSADSVKIAPDGSVWLGQLNPSRWISGTGWITYPSPILSNPPRSIAFEPKGDVWFGEPNLLAYFDGTSWTKYVNELATNGKQVDAIAISGSNRWFGGRSYMTYWGGSFHWYYSGLHHFDGTKWETFTATHGLLSSSWGSDVNDLAFDQAGTLWIATRAGVQCHNGITFTNVYTTGNSGLPSNEVFAISVGADGCKWFRTQAGVAVFDGSAWQVYTTTPDGFALGGWGYGKRLVFDRLGNLWISTASGIAVLNENGLPNQRVISESGGILQSLEGDTMVWLPQGAFTATTIVTITSKPISTSGKLAGISHAFDLLATDANTGGPVQLVPGHLIILTFRYAGIDVPVNIDETSLRLYRWTTTGWSTDSITSSVNITDNIVTAEISHLSRFAVLAPQPYNIFLPIVLKN